MQIIITGQYGANLRSTPSLADAHNVIREIKSGSIVSEAELAGDWFRVAGGYIHSSVASIYTPANTVPLLYVPYKSQWDRDANNRTADCGQTCCAMLAAWRGIDIHPNSLMVQSSPNGSSTGDDLVRNLLSVGLQSETRFIDGLEDLPEKSICLVWYGGFSRDSVMDKHFTGLHWLIYLRKYTVDGQDWIETHDPDFWGDARNWGANHWYTLSEFAAAFIPVGGNSKRQIVLLI